MTVAVEVITVRLRDVDVSASSATGHPVGERWPSYPPHRLLVVTFEVANATELILRQLNGEEPRFEVDVGDLLRIKFPDGG
jgi:hypothetical protein